MGRSLREQSAAARAIYEQANAVLGWDLAKVSFEGPETDLTQTKVCQPALFAHGIALLAALREAGKFPAGEPKFALGLSLGELTAYCAAGVFDFATGLKIVAERGRLMQQACEQTEGGMAAIIGEERAKVAELCREFDIEAANFNDPAQTVIAGSKAAVDKACEVLKAMGAKRALPLPVSAPFHSSLMKPAAEKLKERLAATTMQAPRIPVINNIEVKTESEPDRIRAALYEQAFGPVRWVECVRAIRARGIDTIVECGPGKVLAGLAKRIDAGVNAASVYDPATLADVKGMLA